MYSSRIKRKEKKDIYLSREKKGETSRHFARLPLMMARPGSNRDTDFAAESIKSALGSLSHWMNIEREDLALKGQVEREMGIYSAHSHRMEYIRGK